MFGSPLSAPNQSTFPWQLIALHPVPRRFTTFFNVAAAPITVSLRAILLSSWQDDASIAAAKAAAAAAAVPHVGEYQCESCSSDNTSFDIIGGAAVGTRKAETFGRKDAPELILRVVCHACGNNWVEER